jgi:hypothetical protein
VRQRTVRFGGRKKAERRPGSWCSADSVNRTTVGHPPQVAREERNTAAAGWETECDAGEPVKGARKKTGCA